MLDFKNQQNMKFEDLKCTLNNIKNEGLNELKISTNNRLEALKSDIYSFKNELNSNIS